MLIGGRYEIERPLGEGGMGIVFRAQDRLSGKTVALKQVLIHPTQLDFSSKGNFTDARIALSYEFRVLATLRHPNIVSVLDYGFDEKLQPYFTMELLPDSVTLLNAGKDLTDAGKVDLIIQMLQGLSYLHGRGLLHRDLKPSNVLVVDEQVKIIDFGLAIPHSDATDPVGTLPYIAPEVFEGAPHSVAADLYAVGLIAYSLFARRYPFDTRQSPIKLIDDILKVTPRYDGIPEVLQPVISRLLAKTPAERYATAAEGINAFSTALGQPVPTESDRESFLQAAEFVGRKTELETLTKALQNLAHGQGSAWVIGGESGVGKSRLAEEIRIRALVQGALVLIGQGVDAGGLPYQLWREPIRRLVLSAEISIEAASVFKELVPDIENLLQKPIPDAPLLVGEAHQVRLVSHMIDILKTQKQVVLIVEDLQWTQESLEILKRISANIAYLPLLVVGTYRLDEAPQLHEALPKMNQMMLNRLAYAEISQLCQSMLGGAEIQPDLVAFVQRETEGNALFIVEVMRVLAEEAGSLRKIGLHTLPTQVMAQGMQSVIERRLAKVPRWGQNLLQFAAVAGRMLDYAVLEAYDRYQLERWLTECANRALLVRHDGQWQFSHDKLREGVLQNLPLATKQALHQQVAGLIERVHADQLPLYYADLAYHYHHAAVDTRECHYSYLAGKEAARRYSNTEAAQFLSRALELTPTDNLAERFRILQSRVRVYSLLGRRADQLADLETLETLATDDAQIAYVAVQRTEYHESIADFDPLPAWAEKAIAHAQRAGLVELETTAQFWWGRGLRRQTRYEEARAHTQEALRLAKEGEILHLVSDSLRLIAYIYNQEGDYRTGFSYLKPALEMAIAIGNRHNETWARLVLGEMMIGQGNFEIAQQQFNRARELSRHIGDRWGEAWASIGIAILHRLLNRMHDALRENYESERLSRETQDESLMCYVLMNRGTLFFELGAVEQGIQYENEALALCEKVHNNQVLCHTHNNLAWFWYLRGSAEKSLYHAEQSIDVSRQYKMKVAIFDAILSKGYALLLGENYAGAIGNFEKMVEFHTEHLQDEKSMIADAWIGLAYAHNALDNSARASSYVNQAVALIDRYGLWILQNTTVVAGVAYEVLLALGDERANQVLKAIYNHLNETAQHLDESEQVRYWEATEYRRRIWHAMREVR